jgi:hypothetical protein
MAGRGRNGFEDDDVNPFAVSYSPPRSTPPPPPYPSARACEKLAPFA